METNTTAERMPIIAITVSTSTRVKPFLSNIYLCIGYSIHPCLVGCAKIFGACNSLVVAGRDNLRLARNRILPARGELHITMPARTHGSPAAILGFRSRRRYRFPLLCAQLQAELIIVHGILRSCRPRLRARA